MDTFVQDVRYAARKLIQSPAFTAVAVITLALGIGANSAIFSVVNAVLLRSLPFPEAERLVGVYHSREGGKFVMSPPNFRDVREQNSTLADMAALSAGTWALTGVGDPVSVPGSAVTASFFEVLRVRPALGRTFHPDENEPGKHRVVVLGHALWQQRFGSDPEAIGRTVMVDAEPYTIIGVMPAGFSYPEGQDLWVPFEFDEDFFRSRGAWYLDVVGRLRPGVSAEQAAADVATIAARLEQEYPASNTKLSMTVAPLREEIVGRLRPALLILLGAVGLVLLIACANVANLLLARGTLRGSELAVRTAIGASRTRLVRQLITESLLLGLAGGVLGLLVSIWATSALVALQPQGVPRLAEVRVDGAVVAFTAVVALLTGLIFGTLPALQATGADLTASLKEGGRGGAAGRGPQRLRGTLVVTETALAVLLLVGAGLLLRSFMRLQSVDPGFQSERTLAFELNLPESEYDEQKQVVFFDRLIEALRGIPGVESAGAVMALPLTDWSFNLSFDVRGRPERRPGEEQSMQVRMVTPDFFRTLGIGLRAGRGFTDADRPGSTPVAILSESAVQTYFPGEDPVGQYIQLGWRRDGEYAGGYVVGIVDDVKQFGLNEADPQPVIYFPYAQLPFSRMEVVVRSAGDPLALRDAVQAQVRELDPNLPLNQVRTVEQIVAHSISEPRFYMLLLGIFAAVALLLGAVGIFGVMSYSVAQRTREIGIRSALGADRSEVVGMVVRQAMALAGAGIVIGLVAALLTSRVLRSLLFDLSPTDPLTFVGVALVLGAVGLAASYLPARRAARVDPMVALRAE